MPKTPSQRAMDDADRLGEIVHHALWPGCPRSLYPRLTDADRARYRAVAVAVIDALNVCLSCGRGVVACGDHEHANVICPQCCTVQCAFPGPGSPHVHFTNEGD